MEGTTPPSQGHSPYESCEQCGAPVEHAQRYCVVCGTRRRTAPDPAARYMSAATSRARSEARRMAAVAGPGAPGRRGAGGGTLGTALVIALIPLGVLGGVLIGHHSNDDNKLLKQALAEKPQVITQASSSASTDTAGSSTSGTAIDTSFPLSKGYAIELSTLPSGTSQSAAQTAVSAAKATGASDVGVVSLTTYTVSPAPKNAGFIVYSGHFSSKSAAESALKTLKKKFPAALVVSVKSASSGPAKVLTKTKYGSATQATNYKPTAKALQQGESVAQSVAKDKGKNYVKSQTGLPSVVSVP